MAKKTDDKDSGAAAAQAALDNPQPAAEPVASSDGLVPMTKDGVTLDVHPTAVREHAALGWKQ